MKCAIASSPDQTNCVKCLALLEAEGLKCNRCSSWLHLRCSDLPMYMLLRLKTSQAAYICGSCVKGEGDPVNMKAAEEKIAEIMRVEEDSVKKTSEDVNASIDLMMENNNVVNTDKKESVCSNVTTNQIAPSQSNVVINNKDLSIPKDVCPDYLQKKCKHGKSGKIGGICPMNHPRLCFKYLKNGKGREGCVFGDRCNFYHPKICFQFAKRNKCNRTDCSFYHSTLRRNQNKPKRGGMDKRSSDFGDEANRKDYMNKDNTNRKDINNRNTAVHQNRGWTGVQAADETPTFLEIQRMMKNQMEQMQQMVKMMMMRESVKENPPSRECRCGQHSC